MADKEFSKEDLDRGMKIPGMASHINRKKAVWRDTEPTDAILNRWIRSRICDMITCELLRIKTTKELIDMYGGFINVED